MKQRIPGEVTMSARVAMDGDAVVRPHLESADQDLARLPPHPQALRQQSQ
jgi:hypothetical protein